MYTNIPKDFKMPAKMLSDDIAEQYQAEYYEKKYFGSDTAAQLSKDTYTKINEETGLPEPSKKLSFKDKFKNFWNGTGSNTAKVLGLIATVAILFKKGKGGKITEVLKKAGIKVGEKTATKTGITTKLTNYANVLKDKAKDVPSKIGNLIKKIFITFAAFDFRKNTCFLDFLFKSF